MHKDLVKTLIPVLSKKEKQEIIAYYSVYEKYSKEFSKKAEEDLKQHPVFGKLIKDMPREAAEENNRISTALQKDAIINDNWQPYIAYQIEQGIVYAKMGLGFKSWFEVISLVRNYLMPYLHLEYEDSDQFLSALNGMNSFLDIAMGVIGEAYMQEKKEIILDDQKKIEKLNEELEQKVIERTTQLGTTNKELEMKVQLLKESEARAQTNQKIFSTVFYKSPVMNSITDAVTGKFIDVNENFVEFCGVSKEKIIGQSSLELDMIPDPKHRASIIKSIKEKGYSSDVLIEIGTKKGVKWVSSSAHAVNISGKDCFITAMIDVTERKKAEEQLETVNKELEAFTYSISHDLRAPLRAVNGYAEMLNEDYNSKLDEDGKRILQTIKYNATKMGTLIDDLLAFSRLGRKELLKTEIDVTEMLEVVVNELNKSITNNAEIKVGEMHKVKADYSLLNQVLHNLIANAIKYSSKKKDPLIEIFSEEKNGEIIFSVKDNGAGFDMRYVDKLFGVFQRLHSEEEFEGTGVGLAIVQRIVTKHGGKVWAEGKVDDGAVFKFSLIKN